MDGGTVAVMSTTGVVFLLVGSVLLGFVVRFCSWNCSWVVGTMTANNNNNPPVTLPVGVIWLA